MTDSLYAAALLAALIGLGLLSYRYKWAEKIMDFIFGPKEKD